MSSPKRRGKLFQSFWMAGYECACHLNSEGERQDLIAGLEHDVKAAEDYAALAEVGIRTARDGVRWHLIEEKPRYYNFESLAPMAAAAREQGVQVIWDICHYGWPDGLDIFSAEFVDRFARFAAAVAHFFREQSDDVPFYAPVNEINFFSWGASRPLMYPYAKGRDAELKRQMVRAGIAACEAIWDVDKRARFLWPEPIIHTIPPLKRPEKAREAHVQRYAQFEAWDMIAGRCAPELGGHEKYLDILGLNFYSTNQWEVPGGRKLHWDNGSDDPRWLPLRFLLFEVHHRYLRPMCLAETSHIGSGRGDWIREIAREVRLAAEGGTYLEGICLYPILDRYDWDNKNHWHNSGLWDFNRKGKDHLHRVLNKSYWKELQAAQASLREVGCW